MSHVVELQLCIAPRDDRADIVRRWLVGAANCVLGIAADGVGGASKELPTPPLGGVGQMSAHSSRRSKTFPWKSASVDDMIKWALAAADTPLWANLHLNLRSVQPFQSPVSVNFEIPEADSEWTILELHFDPRLLDDPQIAERILSFAREFSASSKPTFGHIAPMFDNARTALEMLLRVFPDGRLSTTANTLRGYSWLTICSEGVADVLGGAAALRASGAFNEIIDLNGPIWMVATSQYRAYDQEAAKRVFAAVAKALPAGMPTDPSGWSDRTKYKIVVEDAAAHQ